MTIKNGKNLPKITQLEEFSADYHLDEMNPGIKLCSLIKPEVSILFYKW